MIFCFVKENHFSLVTGWFFSVKETQNLGDDLGQVIGTHDVVESGILIFCFAVI
jgi:hypothetical protein